MARELLTYLRRAREEHRCILHFYLGGKVMLSWAITFLVIALIAAVLGFVGLAGTASTIAWILFAVFLFASLISLVTGRQGPVT
jgi:uncharacterized membrane protein YtjA (UPF0391 family)